MYDLVAFDSFGEALRQSTYTEAKRRREDLARISSDLVQLYEGNQAPCLEAWLQTHTSDDVILRAYLQLAVTVNVVKMLVDRTSTIGLVRPIWIDVEAKKPNLKAQDNWRRMVEEWCSNDWDAFVQENDQKTNLLRARAVTVGWDDWNKEILLRGYGPHEMFVGYEENNPNALRPDRFRFVREDATGWEECWDFSSRAPGPSGRCIHYEDGKPVDTVDEFPVLDERTDRSLVPVVAFRSVEDASCYFPWDNQDDLVKTQEMTNRVWTRISVLTEMAVNKIPLFMGSGWADKEGRMKPFIFDFVRPLRQPEGDLGQDNTKPLLTFVGPEVHEEMRTLLAVADSLIDSAASRMSVAASQIRAKGEAISGYSLQIEGSSLVSKHLNDVRRAGPAYKRLIHVMRQMWNHHAPKTEWRIPEGVEPMLVIPRNHTVVTTREQVDAEIKLCETGLKRPLPAVFDYDPSIPAETAFEMADRFTARMFTTQPPVSTTGEVPPPAPPEGATRPVPPATQPPTAAGA